MAGGHDNERRNRSESDYNFPCMLSTQKIVYFVFLVECSKEVRGNSKCVFYWQPNNARFPRGLGCFHTTWTQGGEGAKETHFSFLRSFSAKKNFLKIDARRHCWAEAAEAPEPEKGRERNAFRSCRLTCLTYFGSLSCPWNA